MNPQRILFTAIALGSLTAMTACTRPLEAANNNVIASATQTLQVPPTTVDGGAVKPAQQAGASLPRMVVHKSASCGCCGLWVDHMRAAGFEVEVRDSNNMNPVKERVGVPFGKGSCHTAEIGGYFIEGHVPAEDVKRLLRQGPDAKGLVLPGMPAGSPGMEMPDGTTQPYTVELVRNDGTTTGFAQH